MLQCGVLDKCVVFSLVRVAKINGVSYNQLVGCEFERR